MKKFFVSFAAIIATLGIGMSVVVPVYAEAELPEIYISAINPGYTVDGVSNVGEMIEISRTPSDAPISLAGLSIRYTNSSGNSYSLAEFPEHSWMVGEKILLSLVSSPGHELAAIQYTKTIAFKAGPLELVRGEEVIDSVCWTGKKGCAKEFKSAKPTTLVRNKESGEFEHMDEYEMKFDPESYYEEKVEDEVLPSQCKGVIISEILSYYETSKTEQFVEIYNTGSEQVRLDGCKIKYKNKYIELSGVMSTEEYYAKFLDEFSLTKNPTTSNRLELIDTNGDTIDVLDYPNGQRKGTAYALIGYDTDGAEIWHVTYAPTPGEANNYQEYKTCEKGKVLNKETGNCVKVTEVVEKLCKDGYYLNILTGRCNKIKTAAIKTCKEGYVLNEETGRCVKIKENTGADYALKTEEYEESSSFVALYAVLGVVGVGLIYIIYEYWGEILKFWRKVFRRSH